MVFRVPKLLMRIWLVKIMPFNVGFCDWKEEFTLIESKLKTFAVSRFNRFEKKGYSRTQLVVGLRAGRSLVSAKLVCSLSKLTFSFLFAIIAENVIQSQTNDVFIGKNCTKNAEQAKSVWCSKCMFHSSCCCCFFLRLISSNGSNFLMRWNSFCNNQIYEMKKLQQSEKCQKYFSFNFVFRQ